MHSSKIPALDAALEKMRNGETEIQYVSEFVDASAIIVAVMLPSSKLTKLVLGWHITDIGVMKLAEMVPSSKLTYLDLSGNMITDAGAIKLAEMLPSSNLTYLSLRRHSGWYNYPIGDPGATKLAEMLPSSKLTHLDLTNHTISESHTLWTNHFVRRNKYGVDIEIVGKGTQ